METPSPQKTNPQPNQTSSGGSSGGTGLEPNIASLICYLCGWVTGLIFLVLEKENKEIKFHAWQSILFTAPINIAQILLYFLSMIPIIGIIFTIAMVILGLVTLAILVLLMIKAYQGEHYILPYVGEYAEKQANKPA